MVTFHYFVNSLERYFFEHREIYLATGLSDIAHNHILNFEENYMLFVHQFELADACQRLHKQTTKQGQDLYSSLSEYVFEFLRPTKAFLDAIHIIVVDQVLSRILFNALVACRKFGKYQIVGHEKFFENIRYLKHFGLQRQFTIKSLYNRRNCIQIYQKNIIQFCKPNKS